MSVVGTDWGGTDRRHTRAGVAIVAVALLHLLVLSVGSIRPVPEGVVLEATVVIALAAGGLSSDGSSRVAVAMALSYGFAAGVALVAITHLALPWAAVGVGTLAAGVLYGVHRYALLRLGLLEGSS